jgi:hypothetical protein
VCVHAYNKHKKEGRQEERGGGGIERMRNTDRETKGTLSTMK